jgi:uncharacterized protein YbjT (DUF2867 family)
MKYTITGSLGNISKPLAEKLIAAGHQVTIISSKEDRKKEIESLGGRAAIGSVEDVSFLTAAFQNADAVYTMVPPNFSPSDWKKYLASIGRNYAQAIRNAEVKYVVNLSSIGAHMSDGCGPVSGLHDVENALNEIPNLNVRHLRPGFFYSNFFAQVGLAKSMGFVGGNYGTSNKLILAHTDDIADVAATELLELSFTGKSYRYIASDEKTTDEIAGALGKAVRKLELKWVDLSDEQNHQGLVQAGLPDEIASNYTEMGTAMRSGEMFSDYRALKSAPTGKKKLTDFATEFAAVYNQ